MTPAGVRSATANLVRRNIRAGDVLVLPHALKQLRARRLDVDVIVSGALNGEPIEDYPHDDDGPAVLMLQSDGQDRPLHVIWRIEAATAGPALLVTAYEPDQAKWSADFRQRR